MWTRASCSSVACRSTVSPPSPSSRSWRSGCSPVGCSRASAGFVRSSTAPPAGRRAGRAPTRRASSRAAVPRRLLVFERRAAARPRPSSRCAGRGAAPPPRRRSGPRRAPPRGCRTARSRSAAVFGPTPRAPGILSEGSPRSAMKSGHLGRLDAVALAHLGRADPGERAAAALRLEDRRALARRAGTCRGRRSRRAPSPPRASSNATRGGEEVVRLVPVGLRGSEAHRLDELRRQVELLEQRVVELAAALVARRAPRAGRSGR